MSSLVRSRKTLFTKIKVGETEVLMGNNFYTQRCTTVVSTTAVSTTVVSAMVVSFMVISIIN